MSRVRHAPIGLDVGTRWVKAAQVAWRAGKARLCGAACFARAEPGGAVSAAEMDRIAGVLDRRGFVGRACVMSVDRRSLMTAELELPPDGSGAPREQIARLELARTHRTDAEGFELGMWEVPAPARAGPGAHALAVACPHERAEAVLEAATGAGLDVLALDHPGCALARMAALGAGATRAVLDVGWSSTVLILARQGSVLYERVIEGGSIGALIGRVSEQTGLGEALVEELFSDGLLTPSEDARRGRHVVDRAARCIADFADSVGRELRLSLDYLAHRFPSGASESAPISSVELAGGGGAAAGVVERMARACGVELRPLRPSDLLGADGGVTRDASLPALCLASGLALRGAGGAP